MKGPPSIEHRARLVLLAGVWASGVLLALGILLSLLRGNGPGNAPATPAGILQFALAHPLHPWTFLYGGLLLLMFTPILRVVAALTGFAGERDRWFVLVSSIVLLLLLGEVSYALFLR